MYETLTLIHSLVRWLAVIAAVLATLYALYGVATRAAWAATGDLLGSLFTWSLRVNLFVGIVLWILRFNLTGFNAFFHAVHPIIMFIALAIAEMLAVARRRQPTPERQWRLLLIGVVVPLILIFAAIPTAARFALR